MPASIRAISVVLPRRCNNVVATRDEIFGQRNECAPSAVVNQTDDADVSTGRDNHNGMSNSRHAWRGNKGNSFPLVAAVDSEIVAVDCEYGVSRVQLAHSNQTEVRQIGLTIRESLREHRK